MPRLSGVGLLCKMMGHMTRKNIPVIMMSSHDSMGLVFKCLSRGAVDFLVKPIRKNELKNLWQHVWRRCHSSSGSGCESGTRTQKSMKSASADESYNNSGSNNEENNQSPPLNFGDGSDHGSGTQSSWTKQSVEGHADSPHPVSSLNEIVDCPGSTCGQVGDSNAVFHGKKTATLAALEECQEQELPDNTEMTKVLEISLPMDSDMQSAEVPVGLAEIKENSTPKIGSSGSDDHRDNKMMNFNGKNRSTESRSGVPKEMIVIADSPDPRVESKEYALTNKSTKNSETTESDKLSFIELRLKKRRGVHDVKRPVPEDRNVLRRSESSAFSRYNAASHNRTTDASSPSLLDKGAAGKNNSMCDVQSHSGSNTPHQCSNGTSAFKFTQRVVLGSEPPETQMLKIMPLKTENVYPHQKIMLQSFDDPAAAKEFIQPRNLCQELQPKQLNLHSDHSHLPRCTMLEEPLTFGSSNIGPIDCHAGNYCLNVSTSGSNVGSNGLNGCSTTAKAAGRMNSESVQAKNGSFDAGQTASGSRINQSKLARREVAVSKFRQKRKERYFKRKVRALEEQGPSVRAQFVQQTPTDALSKGTDR